MSSVATQDEFNNFNAVIVAKAIAKLPESYHMGMNYISLLKTKNEIN